MDLTKMSITELKVLGYDLVAQLEQVKQNLQLVAIEINKKQQVVQPQPIVEVKTEQQG